MTGLICKGDLIDSAHWIVFLDVSKFASTKEQDLVWTGMKLR